MLVNNPYWGSNPSQPTSNYAYVTTFLVFVNLRRLYQWVTGRQLFNGLINYFLTCQESFPSLPGLHTN